MINIFEQKLKNIAYNKLHSSRIFYKNNVFLEDACQYIIDRIYCELYILRSEKNQNDLFLTVINWFLDFSNAKSDNYYYILEDTFIEYCLPNIARYLTLIVNNNDLKYKYYSHIKTLNYFEFDKLLSNVEKKFIIDNNIDDKKIPVCDSDKPLNIQVKYISNYLSYINSEFNNTSSLFNLVGGIPGYNLCISESSHYKQIIKNYNLFIVYDQNYINIDFPKNPYTTNPYDRYGLSIIYLLLTDELKLKRSFLRYGSLLSPARIIKRKHYTGFLHAFETFDQLHECIGFNVYDKIRTLY